MTYSASPWSLVLDNTVDGVVADGVLAGHLVVRHAGVLEPVAPDDVLRHVGGAGLDAGPRLRRRALNRHDDLELRRGEVAGLVVVLESNLREFFTITEKDPTRVFSWLKAPTSAFTLKTLL